MFKLVKKAYDVLSDPKERLVYDNEQKFKSSSSNFSGNFILLIIFYFMVVNINKIIKSKPNLKTKLIKNFYYNPYRTKL